MSAGSASVTREIGRLFVEGSLGGLSDVELLDRFLDNPDPGAAEHAFSVLMMLYGPMVLAVCRQVLGDHHLTEDAFQATFFVLSRKASRVREYGRGYRSIRGWLHEVAVRVAQKARSNALRRRARERELGELDPCELVPEPMCDFERRLVVHEEIGRLPPKYRDPVILYYLEGLTLAEVATQLNRPIATVGTQLKRARGKLEPRLIRRGVGVARADSLLLIAGPMAVARQAALRSSLVRSTAADAVRWASGGAVPRVAARAPEASELAGRVLRAMAWASRTKPALTLALLAGLVLAIGLRSSTAELANINPAAPNGADSHALFSATMSHLSLAATIPKATIAEQLERAIPQSFKFDRDNNGLRVYGAPSRRAIAVMIDPADRRVSVPIEFSGRVQVEKRRAIDIPFAPTVGIDFAGDIAASFAPSIDPNWDVKPQLSLSAHLNRAPAKIASVDVDVTGLLRDGSGDALQHAKGAVEVKLKEMLDLRQRSGRLWDQIGSVHRLSDNPAIWLRITPRLARFGQFQFTADAIHSGLGLDLEMHIFIQDQPPAVLKSPLPDLQIGANPADAFFLSIPAEVPQEAVNQQLNAQLTEGPMYLPNGTSFTVTEVTISSYKTKALLSVNFRAKQGSTKSASGRLYVACDPMLDAAKCELRLSNLAFTSDSKAELDQKAGWLGRAELLCAMSETVLINIENTLAQAKNAAKGQLDALNTKLSYKLGVHTSLIRISIDGLVFAKDRTFVVVTAKGKMSAALRP